jgi:ABC-2 type transport system permease protein
MSTTTGLAKYLAFARIAATQARRDRGELYGRVVFFAVILGVFSSLWRATTEAGVAMAGDPRTLVWYLAATEYVLLSAPLIHIDIQDAVRRGDVMHMLGRPVSYVGAAFAEGLGQLVIRAPLLGATAFICAFAFTGWIPPSPALVAVASFGLIAAALLTALHLGIGLLAFWLEDVSPVYWIASKLLFVLGGLMLPLGFYPEWMQQLAALTPFPVILAAPASFVLESGAVAPHLLAIRLVMWGGFTAIALRWLFGRATSRLTINGG